MNFVNEFLKGALYGLVAQIITFLQLQGNIKWGLLTKYPILTLLASVPMGWMFMKSVEHFVLAYNGQIWPSRLIGFAIGIIVFATMSILMFKEPINVKTFVCLVLACCILGVQIFWK
jgi:multidrug transporter EmrE-like cation transporter